MPLGSHIWGYKGLYVGQSIRNSFSCIKCLPLQLYRSRQCASAWFRSSSWSRWCDTLILCLFHHGQHWLSCAVTFYKITVKSIEVSWTTGQAAFHLQLSKGIKFDRNDLGSGLYKRVNSLKMPFVSCKLLLTSSSKRKTWLEAAEFNVDVDLDIYSTPHNHQAQTNAQLAFLDEQDRITGRAKRLFAQLKQRRDVDSGPGRCLWPKRTRRM